MTNLILAALQNDPLLVEELSVPYGPQKHPDHEYFEQQLRSVGWFQEANDLEGHEEEDGRKYICEIARLAHHSDLPQVYLLWKEDKQGRPIFYLKYIDSELDSHGAGVIPLSDIKAIEDNGDVVLSNDTVFFGLVPPPEDYLRVLESLEYSGFKLMRGSDSYSRETPVHLFKKGMEVIGIYQGLLTNQPMAEHVDLKGTPEGLMTQTRGVWKLDDFLRHWHTRNFTPPKDNPSPL